MPTYTTCKFAGQTFAGACCAPQIMPPDIQMLRKQYWDLAGVTEIVGKKGGRAISVQILLFKQYSDASKVLAALEGYQDLQGQNAHLVFAGTTARTYKNSTLDKVTPIAFPGQEQPGPLPDVAGTLDGGWWMMAQFDFYQLQLAEKKK